VASRRGGRAHWRCFVGAVGEGDVKDFTSLGDAVNATARLSAHAGDLDTTGLEHRTLELRGKNQSVDAWVVHAA
jgi:class 3 adenylate cyclase